MGKVLEYTSMLLLGILLILAMTHFLNGTLIEWVQSKFTTGKETPSQKQQPNPGPAIQGNPTQGLA